MGKYLHNDLGMKSGKAHVIFAILVAISLNKVPGPVIKLVYNSSTAPEDHYISTTLCIIL